MAVHGFAADDARKPVVRYKLSDEALQANGLTTAWQVLTEPIEQDRLRREHGPLVENTDPSVALSLGLSGD